MAMKRTTVFADEDDLAVLKATAARRGITEATLLRDAIHLAAMNNRTWDEPFFTRSYTPQDRSRRLGEGEPLQAVWAEKSEAYEQSKRPR